MSQVTTTDAMPVKRSWADIVKGESVESDAKDTQQRLSPGVQGSLLCQCRGEVLAMMAHYGWLIVFGDIDHPAVENHEGRIYVNKADIVDGEVLGPGDVVSFYLFADDKGLGAEWVTLEQRAAPSLNPDANVFEPTSAKDGGESEGHVMRVGAAEFVPSSTLPNKLAPGYDLQHPVADVCLRLSEVFASDDEDEEDYTSTADTQSDAAEIKSRSMRPDAAEFVPSAAAQIGDKNASHPVANVFSRMSRALGKCNMRAEAEEFVPSVAFNQPVPPLAPVADVFLRLSLAFASEDEDGEDEGGDDELDAAESSCNESDDVSVTSDAKLPQRGAPTVGSKSKTKRASSPDGSTSAGVTSESEGESSCDAFPLLLPAKIRPPPGLSLA